MTRDQIIKMLDTEPTETGLYDKLKACIGLKYQVDIDPWFKGVIESLYYRPNHILLVLKGSQGIGKTYFLSNLIDSEIYSDRLIDKEQVYSSLIVNAQSSCKSERELLVSYLKSDYFMVLNPYTEKAVAEKRLCSYCTTTNEDVFNGKKSVIILDIDYFDRDFYDSIDKLNLWIEIFNIFKPNK